MNNYVYAINKSFENMKQAVNAVLNKNEYEEKERQELFFYIGTCIHWMLDYEERIEELNENDKKYISAFKYVNNSLKHAFEVREISTQKGGFTFPVGYPLTISKRQIVWSVVDNGHVSQMNNYKEFLNGQDVITTSEKAIEILMKYALKG